MKKALRNTRFGQSLEKRAIQMSQLRVMSSLYYRPYNMGEALSRITPQTALALPACYCAINRIATDIASMGLGVFQSIPGGGSRFAEEHYLNPILGVSPDEVRTAFHWKQLEMAHILGWGNGFSQIETDGGGRVKGLHPVHPTRMQVLAEGNKHVYVVDNLADQAIPAKEMLHLYGMSTDGISGISPIRANAMAISTGLEQSAFSVAFYQNASTPQGFVEMPGKLLPETEKQLRDSFEQAHQGPEKAFRVGFLSGGAHWVNNTVINPVDAELVSAKNMTVQDVARIYSIPLSKLMEWTNAHYANTDQAQLDYMVSCLRGWCECLEASYDWRLLTPKERADGYYIAHAMEDVLRGDEEARARFYASAIQSGWLSVDEIRAREKMGKVSGGGRHWIQRNMLPLDTPDEILHKQPNEADKGTSPAGPGNSRFVLNGASNGQH